MDARDQLRRNLGHLEEIVGEAADYFEQQHDKPAAEGGPWGPKEVLAHILYWHERTCLNVEDVLAGKVIQPATRSVDELNVEAVERFGQQPMSALVEQLRSLQRRVRSDLQAVEDPNVVVIVRANGVTITALERPDVMANHIKSHLEELRSQ